jgi:hypothetical protein
VATLLLSSEKILSWKLDFLFSLVLSIYFYDTGRGKCDPVEDVLLQIENERKKERKKERTSWR